MVGIEINKILNRNWKEEEQDEEQVWRAGERERRRWIGQFQISKIGQTASEEESSQLQVASLGVGRRQLKKIYSNSIDGLVDLWS